MDTRSQANRHDLRKKQNNVIAMRFDAAFYFERGVKFLQRNELKKALKAFRKTVEYEPQNPINHCNLAGVLSEMGNFQASNEVLLHVLEQLDPDMAECQFYLANNYANLGQYDVAEEHVLKYLDADPDGEYAEDAEDMLDVLLDEFGGGEAYQKWEQERQAEEFALAKRDGRHLLEQGQFEAAVEWLEGIVSREPENTAAQNNLSLAYYYTGLHAKAVAMAEQVLDRQSDNIHALCNLTVFTKYAGSREQLNACIRKLVKVFPLHFDLAMKVGTTLGLVGHHLEAMRLFERIARITQRTEPVLLHSIAASAANAGQFRTAKKWWKELSLLSELEDIANYYLEQLDGAVREKRRALHVSYQYDMPLQMQFAEMKKRLQHTDAQTWRTDPLLRASLYWGLRNGSVETRRAVIRTLAFIADDDAKKALFMFLKRPDIDTVLQSAAILALRHIGAIGSFEIYRDGELTRSRMSDMAKDLVLQVDPLWQVIWLRTETWLRANHHARLIKTAKRTWVAYAEHVFFNTNSTSRIGKPDVMAGGLVYLTLRYHGVHVVQRELAEAFQVSPASIRKSSIKLEEVMLQLHE